MDYAGQRVSRISQNIISRLMTMVNGSRVYDVYDLSDGWSKDSESSMQNVPIRYGGVCLFLIQIQNELQVTPYVLSHNTEYISIPCIAEVLLS